VAQQKDVTTNANV